MRAPWMIDSPTPPQPNTATVCPACSPELRSAAPTPVSTPQPTSAARSSGRSASIRTSEFSCSSIFSAKLPIAAKLRSGFPPCDRRGSAFSARATMSPVQTFGCPLRHCGQVPQKPERQATT